MKLTLAEPRFLKESVNIISDLVNEVRFKIDSDKIEMIAMDPANVAMIIFKLLSSAFVEYEVEHERELCVSLESLKQVLRRAKPSDTLTLTLDLEKNYLKVLLKGESIRAFDLPLIDIDERVQKVPELNFPLRIETSSFILDEAIEDVGVVAESVALTAFNNKFVVQSEGNMGAAKIEVSTDDETNIAINGVESVSARYSVEYLKKIIKGSKLADTVVLQFDKDYPLKVDFKVMDKMQMSFILAPRVENL